MAAYDEYYDDDNYPQGPCEFCGDLFPLILLIEHESGCRPDLLHYNMEQIHAEQAKNNSSLSSGTVTNTVTKAEEAVSSNIGEKIEETNKPKQVFEQYQTEKYSKTEREKFQQYMSKQPELSNEMGEQLLSYGTSMDPEKDSEDVKEIHKMPENLLQDKEEKKDDVVDINSLSDDECNESLEEFWKRAQDFLKYQRNKKKTELMTCS